METVQKNLISLEPVALDDGKELFGNFYCLMRRCALRLKGLEIEL